jgi:hypothetical protein
VTKNETQAPPSTMKMVNEGVEELSGDPIPGHDCLPCGVGLSVEDLPDNTPWPCSQSRPSGTDAATPNKDERKSGLENARMPDH